MAYCIDSGIWSSVFAVPTAIVDQHIKLCSPLSLKVLLVMLRYPGEPFDPQKLSKLLNLSPADISDAMGYWIGTGLLQEVASDSSATPAAPATPSAQPTLSTGPSPSIQVRQSPEGQRITTVAARPKISREDVAAMAAQDPTMAQLLRVAQEVLGNPLSPVESEILASLRAYYGLPTDTILMLLQYCVSIGHRSMNYLEKTAASWLGKGIVTHEQAEQEILRLTRDNENEKKVMHAFGIFNRTLAPREREYVHKWFQLGLDERLIALACEWAVENTGKVSFAYADRKIWQHRLQSSGRLKTSPLKQENIPPSTQRSWNSYCITSSKTERGANYGIFQRDLSSGLADAL